MTTGNRPKESSNRIIHTNFSFFHTYISIPRRRIVWIPFTYTHKTHTYCVPTTRVKTKTTRKQNFYRESSERSERRIGKYSCCRTTSSVVKHKRRKKNTPNYNRCFYSKPTTRQKEATTTKKRKKIIEGNKTTDTTLTHRAQASKKYLAFNLILIVSAQQQTTKSTGNDSDSRRIANRR